jgi:hypothetical protein
MTHIARHALAGVFASIAHLPKRKPVPGTVEIVGEHEIETSVAVPGTGSGTVSCCDRIPALWRICDCVNEEPHSASSF